MSCITNDDPHLCNNDKDFDIIINKKYIIMRYNIDPLDCKELTNLISNSKLPSNEDICKIIWKYYRPKPDKEQVVIINDMYISDDNIPIYSFTYGVFGFHEGFTKRENIRELTPTEKIDSENNRFWKLPQQFYQSFPQ